MVTFETFITFRNALHPASTPKLQFPTGFCVKIGHFDQNQLDLVQIEWIQQLSLHQQFEWSIRKTFAEVDFSPVKLEWQSHEIGEFRDFWTKKQRTTFSSEVYLELYKNCKLFSSSKGNLANLHTINPFFLPWYNNKLKFKLLRNEQ